MNTFKKTLYFAALIFFIIMLHCEVLSLKTEKCGKISDYTYNDGNSNVVVANRDAGKFLALTFDDGPSERDTNKILDILAENNIKATFFVIGKNAEKHLDIVKRISNEGHEIGNHTYSHPQMREISPKEVNDEIVRTQQILQGITGKTPKLFRPPGGYLNNMIMEQILLNNCTTVLWSWRQDTMDWKNPPVHDIINTVISNVQDGDIILFHDYIYGDSPTPEALKEIIPKLKNMGYEFVTVSELISK